MQNIFFPNYINNHLNIFKSLLVLTILHTKTQLKKVINRYFIESQNSTNVTSI